MKNIIIGFSKPKNKIFPIFSWLIRLIENTEYSHVYISWYSHNIEATLTYEASGTLVHFISERLFKNKIESIHEYSIEITQEQYKNLLKFCIENAGVPYGIRQVFGIALVKLFALKKNPFSDGKKSQVCCELVGYVLEDVLSKNTNLDLDVAGPRHIKEFLDTLPEAIKIK